MARMVNPDYRAHPEPTALQVPRVQPGPRARKASWGHRARKVLMVKMAPMVHKANVAPPERRVPTVRREPWVRKDLPEPMVKMGIKVRRDLQDQPALRERSEPSGFRSMSPLLVLT